MILYKLSQLTKAFLLARTRAQYLISQYFTISSELFITPVWYFQALVQAVPLFTLVLELHSPLKPESPNSYATKPKQLQRASHTWSSLRVRTKAQACMRQGKGTASKHHGNYQFYNVFCNFRLYCETFINLDSHKSKETMVI